MPRSPFILSWLEDILLYLTDTIYHFVFIYIVRILALTILYELCLGPL